MCLAHHLHGRLFIHELLDAFSSFFILFLQVLLCFFDFLIDLLFELNTLFEVQLIHQKDLLCAHRLAQGFPSLGVYHFFVGDIFDALEEGRGLDGIQVLPGRALPNGGIVLRGHCLGSSTWDIQFRKEERSTLGSTWSLDAWKRQITRSLSSLWLR